MITRNMRIPALLAVLLLLSGCSLTGGGSCGRVAEADVPTVYQLRQGDKLQITVFGEPDLTGEYEVDTDGRVTLPLMGPTEAAGRPVAAVRKEVTKVLNARFMRDAKVSAEVTNYSPFYVLGEVKRPGAYEYEPDLTVRNAIALAGGFTRRSVKSCVQLVRVTPDGETALRVGLKAQVLPRDTIEVERRIF